MDNPKKCLSLLECYTILSGQDPEYHQKRVGSFKKYYALFEQASQCIRYQNIKITNYVNEIDNETMKQFSAITLILEDDTRFIAFRGTDDSLIGWQENFRMFYLDTIASWQRAEVYFQEAAQFPLETTLWQSLKNKFYGKNIKERFLHYRELKKGIPLTLGGHSKGGNIAIYAGIKAGSLSHQIKEIVNFDGPGFSQKIVDSQEYQSIYPKIKTYIPNYSFFGRLFQHLEKQIVVDCYNQGMAQHSLNAWAVNKDGLIEGELDKEVENINHKMNGLIGRIGQDQLKDFVEALFLVYESLGIHTMTEVQSINVKKFIVNINSITKINLKMRVRILEMMQIVFLELKKTKEMID